MGKEVVFFRTLLGKPELNNLFMNNSRTIHGPS